MDYAAICRAVAGAFTLPDIAGLNCRDALVAGRPEVHKPISFH
jgi:hypothetical protein